jgi:hypothetical protein
MAVESADTKRSLFHGNFLSMSYGSGSYAQRDISGRRITNVEDFSPVKLVGNGSVAEFALNISRSNIVHQIGISLNNCANMKYNSGMLETSREQDSYSEIRTSYIFQYYFLNDILDKLDIGAGFRVNAGYANTERFHVPDITLEFPEWRFSGALVIAGRYRPVKSLQINTSLTGGPLLGVEQTEHSISGPIPDIKYMGGLLTDFQISGTWMVYSRLGLSVRFRHIDRIEMGDFLQYIVNKNQLTGSIIYKL